MRGNDIHPRAARRIRSDHRDVALDEFESGMLRDGVHDDIVEDTQLAQLEDAIAHAEDARDCRRAELADGDEDFSREIVRAVEHVQGTVRRRIMEICAERCRVVLVDGDDWLAEGWVEADELEAAKREAANWLLEHEAVTRRLWDESDTPVDTNHTTTASPEGADR